MGGNLGQKGQEVGEKRGISELVRKVYVSDIYTRGCHLGTTNVQLFP